MFKELDELCDEAFDFDAYVAMGRALDNAEARRRMTPTMRRAYEAVHTVIAWGENGNMTVVDIADMMDETLGRVRRALDTLREGGYVSWTANGPEFGCKRGARVYKIEKEV